MLVAVAICVVLTVAAAAYVLAPRLGDPKPRFIAVADRPRAFGSEMAWLAVKTTDPMAVIDSLALEAATPAGWNSGIGTVYDPRLSDTHVFVSPVVKGWTFVVGLRLPHPVSRNFVDKCSPLLVRLGTRFPDVQYFYSYPPVDLFAWARVTKGRLVRAFAVGDEGVLWDKGRITREERGLGLQLFELRGVRGRSGDAGGEIILHPTEEQVWRLAERWSLDPTRLDTSGVDPGVGWVALPPLAWRAERIRKAA